jgi:hypothetical protein
VILADVIDQSEAASVTCWPQNGNDVRGVKMPLLRSLFLLTIVIGFGPVIHAQKEATPNKLPELVPKRPECGVFLPARDERHDLARLVRSEQFLECERDGFPKELAPPWKTSEEGTKKLSDACGYFAGESVRDYPQVGQDNIQLAAARCRIEVAQIILMQMMRGLGQQP